MKEVVHTQKHGKTKLWMWRAAILLLITVFLYAGYQIYLDWRTVEEASQLSEMLIKNAVRIPQDRQQEAPAVNQPEEETVPIQVDFEMLQQENADIIAWIYCPDTPIHYPVVQGEDNSYYLRRLLDGEYNTNGTLFLDYRNSSDFGNFNSIIYGHHMKNGAMFGTLVKYKEQGYYDAHPFLYLLTPEQNYKVELIAGYVTSSDSELYSLADTQEEMAALLETATEKSTFVSETMADADDFLLTLSTCSYEYDNARYVVIGKLTKIG